MRSQSLRDLAALPVEGRYMWVLDRGRTELGAVYASLRQELRDVHAGVSVERLAWAVAFNVASSGGDGSLHQRSHSYLGHWPADTPWTTVWSMLTEPRADRRGERGTTLLRELACSVACERRHDWQHPAFARCDQEVSDRAFEAIHARYRTQVIGEVARRFGNRAGDQEAIADEAWSRVFRDYWSSAARRRFAGLCRISTLVSQVARYCAIDVLRQQTHDGVSYEDGDEPGEESSAHLASLRITSDPVDRLMSAEAVQRIRRCVQQLPARQQVAVQLVWFREVKAVEAAGLLGISEPAVSQMLKRAREGVRGCLGGELRGELRGGVEPAGAAAVAAAGPLTSPSVLRLSNRRSDADRR